MRFRFESANEDSHIEILSELASAVPSDFLPQIYSTIVEITHLPARAKALSTYLPHLPLTTLSHKDWKTHLHLLSLRKRDDLMQDFATLYPAIIHLGGQPAMRGIVDEMKRIRQQWP
jgi:hypothetical protein